MKDRNQKRMRIGTCIVAIGTLFALTLGVASGASAKEYTAARKAGRGLAAMTTGFLELPGNMVAETRRSGPALGFTLGFVKGLGGIVVRELVGVYEFVSAPIEAPRGYRPLIAPEFPWGYFDETRELADTDRSSSVASAEPRASDRRGVSNLWGAPTAAASGR